MPLIHWIQQNLEPPVTMAGSSVAPVQVSAAAMNSEVVTSAATSPVQISAASITVPVDTSQVIAFPMWVYTRHRR